MCSYNRRYAEVCGSEPQAGGGCESVQHCSWDTGSARAAGRTDQHAARRQPQGGSDPVQTGPEEELGQRAAPGRLALTLIRWKGEKSAPLSSRFWKQLQLELPMRRNTQHTHTQTQLPDITQHTPDSHTQNTRQAEEKLIDPYSTSAL